MSNTQSQFFNAKNETMLDRLLYTDFQRRIGGDLTEKQKTRLQKTVRHYMTEVYAKNPGQPVQYLNKEVLQSVVPDYMGYLRRNVGPTVAGEDAETDSSMRADVNTRFDQLQTERQEGRAAPPPAPDFRIPLDEAGPTPLSRFEEVRRMREAEAAREAETAAAMSAAASAVAGAGTQMSQDLVVVPQGGRENPLSRFIDADADFRNSAVQAKARDQLALVMREEAAAVARAEAATRGGGVNMSTLPDPRKVLLGDKAMVPLPPRQQGIAPSNPTVALADTFREKPVLPQDVLRPQEDIVSYKELEHNLYIYSADRDWIRNSTENRYNFSVSFDPANNRSGFGYSPATNIKFKNITRIEFVKAIMPVEACDVQIQSTANDVAVSNTALTTGNVFSFPYLQVRIPELNVNGYGTNDGINNAFAAISYDAYWSAESSASVNKGYARMIPKFLKCQKVFYPTPLATLTKLSFEIQRPDGNLVCDSLDTQDISGFVFSTDVNATGNFYHDVSDAFIWIQTKTYFNRFAFGSGDRIQLKNVDFTSAWKASAGTQKAQEFIDFITRSDGHLILSTGYGATAAAAKVGSNYVGYANWIIIRNKFIDPTTGSTGVYPWGSTFTTQLASSPNPTSGRLINLNHQVQIILRVITREMDGAAKLRPDNLQA